jgi:hypothetical protein
MELRFEIMSLIVFWYVLLSLFFTALTMWEWMFEIVSINRSVLLSFVAGGPALSQFQTCRKRRMTSRVSTGKVLS